jgi:hypothetical protein
MTHREGSIAEPSDRVFSQSCALAYQTAATTCEPRADEIDVIADWTGYGRLRSQYRRLVLPFGSQGQSWLVSGIQLDPAIDLLG